MMMTVLVDLKPMILEDNDEDHCYLILLCPPWPPRTIYLVPRPSSSRFLCLSLRLFALPSDAESNVPLTPSLANGVLCKVPLTLLLVSLLVSQFYLEQKRTRRKKFRHTVSVILRFATYWWALSSTAFDPSLSRPAIPGGW